MTLLNKIKLLELLNEYKLEQLHRKSVDENDWHGVGRTPYVLQHGAKAQFNHAECISKVLSKEIQREVEAG